MLSNTDFCEYYTMKLSMKYMMLYPERELRCIGQMIDSVKNNSSDLNDHAEQHFYNTNVGETDESSASSAAEDLEVYEEFLAEVNQLSCQMAVVSLNVLIEITLKKILKENFGINASEMTFPKIKDAFKCQGVSLSDIDSFTDIDEVRLVSNSIKHGGIVSKYLARANGALYPEVDKDIHLAYLILDQYYSRTRRFLHGLFTQASV